MTNMNFAPNAEHSIDERSVGAPLEGAFLLEDMERQLAAPDYDEPRMYHFKGDGPYRVIMYLGSCTDAEAISEQVVRLYGHLGSIYLANYPKRRQLEIHDMKVATLRSLAEHEDADRYKQTILATHSLGNVVGDRLMMDAEMRQGFGQVVRWAKDGAFSDFDHVRPVQRIGAWVGEKIPLNKASRALYRGAVLMSTLGGITHSAAVEPHEARRHLYSSALMPLDTRKSQLGIIRDTQFEDGANNAAGRQIQEVYVTTPKRDFVLDSYRAQQETARIYGIHAMLLVNMGLDNEHATMFEHPGLTLAALEGVFSEDYRSGVPRFEYHPDPAAIRRSGSVRDMITAVRAAGRVL